MQRVSVDHHEIGVMPGGNSPDILLLAQIAGSGEVTALIVATVPIASASHSISRRRANSGGGYDKAPQSVPPPTRPLDSCGMRVTA